MARKTNKLKKPKVIVKSGRRVLRASAGLQTSKRHKNDFAELKSKVVPVLKPYANRISVFGSYARGEAGSSSDIDLLIALKPSNARPPLGLFKLITLEQTLEKELGREVDLITEDGINERRRRNIEEDRVILYETG